jgi:hypothetical protein
MKNYPNYLFFSWTERFDLIEKNKKIPIIETILQFLLLLCKCAKMDLLRIFYGILKNKLNLLLFIFYKENELALLFRNILSKKYSIQATCLIIIT